MAISPRTKRAHRECGYLRMAFSQRKTTTSMSASRQMVRRQYPGWNFKQLIWRPDKYPIVPTFKDWSFPHTALPTYWQNCKIPPLAEEQTVPRHNNSAGVLARDISCRLTNHKEGTECAHLVPLKEGQWFKRNGMVQYTNMDRITCEEMNDSKNSILLRSDIHYLFDDRRFALVPKPLANASNSTGIVAHVIPPGASKEIRELYHNVALQPLIGIAIEFLFARFAWTIFSCLVTFLEAGVRRNLCIVDEGNRVTGEVSSDRCIFLAKQSKSRSISPKKRKPDDHQAGEDEDLGEEGERGRKRWRYDASESSSSSSGRRSWNTTASHSTSNTSLSENELISLRTFQQQVKPACACKFYVRLDHWRCYRKAFMIQGHAVTAPLTEGWSAFCCHCPVPFSDEPDSPPRIPDTLNSRCPPV